MYHRDPLCQVLSFHAHLEVKAHLLAEIVAAVRDMLTFPPVVPAQVYGWELSP